MNLREQIDSLVSNGVFRKDNIKTDSRRVTEGDVFVALRGISSDGHEHIGQALKNGAAFVVSGNEVPELNKDMLMVVPDTLEALSVIAEKIYGDPSASLNVYGVTGTNGKTTTVFLIHGILEYSGIRSGFTSTVFMKTSTGPLEASEMTTPDMLTVNEALYGMRASGMEAAAVEVSSHALSQGRIKGVKLDSAVFTNITPEHLDYHGNMDSYLRDKLKIVEHLKEGGIAAFNADDPLLKGIEPVLPPGARLIRFGFKPGADVRAERVETTLDGSEFDLSIKDAGCLRVRTRLIGRHNVYNILSAVSAILDSGISMDIVKEALDQIKPVPGRFDAVDSEAPFRVLVDYAHTPDALENVLKCLRPLARNRLLCVFGCGGDRDREKRPAMGSIAASFCDSFFITNDNPRSECPGDILKEIQKGVPAGSDYSIICDRREAIRKAIHSAVSGDIVLIAGKGHENYQILGDTRLRFDDKEVASDLLRDIGYRTLRA